MASPGDSVCSVTAQAHANIALCKYWGKSGPGNTPATPSISLALRALATTTTVRRRSGCDQVLLNGERAAGQSRQRIIAYLDLWRERGLIDGGFRVESTNNFPTAAGLASSAAGFAALATALSGYMAKPPSLKDLSRLARLGSGSAARSIPGGISALGTGKDPAARQLIAPEDIAWRMVIAVVDGPPKKVSSRSGMEISQQTSPYHAAWLKTARVDYRLLYAAVRSWNLERTGELMEANMLAMHACMLAARPVLAYWHPATLSILHALWQWRREGLKAYATIDAGPHVAILCRLNDIVTVERNLRSLAQSGVALREVITSGPAGPAEILARE